MATIRPKARKDLSKSRKSDQRRAEIIRAAIEIVNAKSYAQATVIDIAAAVGLRDATLYHYFHDKRTLVYACHRTSLGRAQRLLEAADQTSATGAEKLRCFIRSMLVDSRDNGALLYLGDFSYLHAAQRRAVRQWVDRLKAVLVRFLKGGMADGSVVACEPELVVELLLGMLIWLGKWTPSVSDLTVERLMSAIEVFGFEGLDRERSGDAKWRCAGLGGRAGAFTGQNGMTGQ